MKCLTKHSGLKEYSVLTKNKRTKKQTNKQKNQKKPALEVVKFLEYYQSLKGVQQHCTCHH